MTNCYKRILLPLLIDKWQIATKLIEYFYPLLIDKWQIATKEYFYATTNR